MRYHRLGGSGLQVSSIVLGAMSFGDPTPGNYAWVLPSEHARPIIKRALELGITTFDTADVYAQGTSEKILGGALRDFCQRSEVVIATKVHGATGEGPYERGLSRKHIFDAVEASLRRLCTDYIDLYQIHRWDAGVPIDETMHALDDLVRAGKVRYLGASSMYAWQFAQAQHTADLGGWTRFVSMQDYYNLLHREEEREMHPYCVDQGVGVIPWSPLARGRLTRPWTDTTSRSGSDNFYTALYEQTEQADRRVVEAVTEVAAQRGRPPAQIALAWVAQQAAVTAPIVGATRLSHLEDAVASLDVVLTEVEIATLEQSYVPHKPVGF
jgi:aryl-alcohol dehydrogenase-like predicted oxidoreductase